MSEEAYSWEFFIAHASGDTEIARKLYRRLAPRARVFLDVEELIEGDDWDRALARAQRDSLIIVVLVSDNTEEAYYQREEIAAAIARASSADKSRRVVPVFLGGKPGEASPIPHGLRLKHGLVLAAESGLDEVASRLLKVMQKEAFKWDFFLAYAPADAKIAKRLYKRLSPHARVFLDIKSLELGQDRDWALARAQNESLVIVVLVSETTDDAYYQREEIAAAIQLARSKEKEHRVVPVFLYGPPGDVSNIPYGLRLKHGLVLSKQVGIVEATHSLLRLQARLTGREAPTASDWNRKLKLATVGASVLVVLVLLILVAARHYLWPPDVEPANHDPVVSTVSEEDSCVKVTHLSPEVIPHYLLNSIGSKDFPYWLKIIASNECGASKFITIRYEGGRNVNLRPPLQETHTIPHPKDDEVWEETVEPDFVLAGPRGSTISVQWSIEDQDQRKLAADTIRTEILAPYTIDWELTRPKEGGGQEQVDKDYLLATLKAWIMKPPESVTERGIACRTPGGGGTALVKEEAIAACYEMLFSGADAIPVLPDPIRFPAGERQRILPHALILDEKATVSSLEAALLLAAVLEAGHQHGVDPDLTLVVGPVEGSSNPDQEKTVFIAWRLAGQRWRGIDLRRASAEGYAANVSSSSGRVATLLDLSSEVRAAIESQGAGFSSDERIAAIDFARIPSRFQIRRFDIVASP